jgi:rare lipoprotein A
MNNRLNLLKKSKKIWSVYFVSLICRPKFLKMNHFFLGIMLIGLISGSNKDVYQTGTASFYANKFEGRKTASGEIFRQDSLTAAHKSLPFGTMLKVTNISNDSVVIVKVNDRIGNSSRVIDLSLKAAQKLNFVNKGLTKVTLEKI